MNNNNELYHFGILGQKWGVRRFQKKDGSLTSAGRKREKASYNKDAYKTKVSEKTRQHDAQFYGKRGASRIEKSMAKGATHEKAIKKEQRRNLAKVLATVTALSAGYALYETGMLKSAVDTGKTFLNGAKDSYLNQVISDAAGNVISKKHSSINPIDVMTSLKRFG